MRFARRAGAATFIVLFALVALGGLALLGTVSEAAASPTVPECFGCYEYEQLCPDGGHMDRYDSEYLFYSEVDEDFEIHENVCASTGCDIHETVCLHTAAALDALERSTLFLERRQWAALAKLITQSEAVSYNVERNALQFTGCNETLVVHSPLATNDGSLLMQELAALNDVDH